MPTYNSTRTHYWEHKLGLIFYSGESAESITQAVQGGNNVTNVVDISREEEEKEWCDDLKCSLASIVLVAKMMMGED